jgi:hypothetical protein
MEYWSVEVLEYWVRNLGNLLLNLTHYSITPLFHYSNIPRHFLEKFFLLNGHLASALL